MSRGHDRERAVRRYLESPGGGRWWTCRACGSLGAADVVASRATSPGGWGSGTEVRLYEVKSTAGGPWERFGPAQRAALVAAAKRAGASAWLAYWPPNRPLEMIPAADWPSA